jgi:hypothetical protein
MAHRSALAAVSSVQLAAQLAGHVVALRRGRHFDVPFLTGSPEHLVRDWLWFGTAYSAPPYLLVPQLWATARLLRAPGDRLDDTARWVLRWLGAGLSLGYPSERCTRARLRPGGLDPVETPVVVAGWGGALALAVLGRPVTGRPGRSRRGRSRRGRSRRTSRPAG